MKSLRNVIFFATIGIIISSSSAFRESSEEEEDVVEKRPFFLGNRPRILSIFSKPQDPEAPKQTGPGILGHLGNVIHGGSIGVHLELRPLNKVQGVLGLAKKIISGGKPETGYPENQKPPSEPYDPPKDENWEEDNDKNDWVPEDPKKPVPDGPSWEDIGEDPEDDANIPYEDIINPRVKPLSRPKRSFLNSKIYYVPLTFRSNAKPSLVRLINTELKMRDLVKSVNNLLRK